MLFPFTVIIPEPFLIIQTFATAVFLFPVAYTLSALISFFISFFSATITLETANLPGEACLVVELGVILGFDVDATLILVSFFFAFFYNFFFITHNIT